MNCGKLLKAAVKAMLKTWLNGLLVLFCYFVSAFYGVFGFLKVSGENLDLLMAKYFALLSYADVSDRQETVTFFLIAFVLWGIGYLMSKRSTVGYVLAAILMIWEMILAKLFYWDVLHSTFWAWEHFLLGIPGLWMISKLIKKDGKNV